MIGLGQIADYCEKPIPRMMRERAIKNDDYRSVLIDRGDPRHSEKPRETRSLGIPGKSYYWQRQPPVPGARPGIYLRRGVAQRLVTVNTALRISGLELFVHDGYRSLLVQRYVRDVSVRARLQQEFPGITEAELERRIDDFAANIGENIETAPPPHLTGGAVDLTIRETGGEQIEMGKSLGLYSTAFPDHFECLAEMRELNDIELQAQKNRRILYWVMEGEGFAVNPTEWWHWSYGDQLWSKLRGTKAAFYGAMLL